jgi:hypothetical protein
MWLCVRRPNKFVIQDFSVRIQFDLRPNFPLLLADSGVAKIA